MINPTFFDYDYFVSLSGAELADYAEPFVTTRPETVPKSAYGSLCSSLASMDEIHIVYTIDICMRLNSDDFIGRAIEYLSNRNASICCAASNAIKRVPKEVVSDTLRKKIATLQKTALYSRDVRSGEEVCIGTNEEFIRDLVSTFCDDHV